MKTLIVGDLHLGKGLSMGKPGIGTNLNSRILDQFKLLDWIFDLAVEKEVSRVVLTGDIFEDLHPHYSVMAYFVSWCLKFNNQEIYLDIIAGNHDLKRSGAYYSSPLDIIESVQSDYVKIYKNIETVFNGDTGLTFLPFRDRKSFNVASSQEALDKIKTWLEYEINSIPKIYDRVLIGHLALDGSLFVGDEIDDALNELMCPADIFEGYDYVWMGHVHKPQVLHKKPYQAHIGSLDLSNMGELDHAKILVLFDPSIKNKFEHISVPSRPLRKLRIEIDQNSKNSDEIILNSLSEYNEKNNLSNSLFKLEIQYQGLDTPNCNRSVIEESLAKHNVFHTFSFSESRLSSVISEEKKQNIENTIDVKSALKMYLKQISLSPEDESTFLEMSNQIIEEVPVE